MKDIRAALGSPRLFREDTLIALHVMAVDLHERLASPKPSRRAATCRARGKNRQLHDELGATATAARKPDDLVLAG